jgi:hypothetical protein
LRNNSLITVLGIKRSKDCLFTTSGRTLKIEANVFTNNIPLADYRYWVLEDCGNTYKVIRAIPK